MTEEKRRIRSFSRRADRKISDERQKLMTEFLPKVSLHPDQMLGRWQLEIGFGSGEHFVKRAELNKQIQFLGVEPFTKGFSRTLKEIYNKNIENIKLYNGDVHDLLPHFPDKIFEEIWILFPDPWPKKKHFKRRMINKEFLGLINKKLRDNGVIIIATDHENYAEWILEHLNDCSFLNIENKDKLHIFPENWIASKYYEKAVKQGIAPLYFSIRKNFA